MIEFSEYIIYVQYLLLFYKLKIGTNYEKCIHVYTYILMSIFECVNFEALASSGNYFNAVVACNDRVHVQ